MTGRVSEIVREHRHIEVTGEDGSIYKLDIASVETAWGGLKLGDQVSFDPMRLARNLRRK